MIQKLTKLVEVVFDVTLNTVKSLLLMLVVTILCIFTLAFGFATMLVYLAT